MNAIAHMTVGLGAKIKNKEEMRLTNYKDADGGDHDHISEIPFIVVAANSNKIRNVRKACQSNNIEFTDFTHAMIEGGYEAQIKRSAETKEEDMDYLGIAMFGDWDVVSELTRKFSLWK